jgi:hypothetical protein
MARSRLALAAFVVALILLWWYTGRAGMENRGFIVTGYGITWGTLLLYAHRLRLRREFSERALAAVEESGDPASGTSAA